MLGHWRLSIPDAQNDLELDLVWRGTYTMWLMDVVTLFAAGLVPGLDFSASHLQLLYLIACTVTMFCVEGFSGRALR